MSLIVAKKSANCIVVTSDTRLTYLNTRQTQNHKPSDGTLKTVNIARNVNISFAGNTVHIGYVYEYLIRQGKTLDIDKFIKALLEININTNFEIDFILSVGSCNIEETKIFSIKKGIVCDVESAWIGSQRAFSEFQKAYHNCKNPLKEFTSISSELTNITVVELTNDEALNVFYMRSFIAMHKVIENTYIEEVGGLVIPCVYINGCFNFKGYSYYYPIGFNRTKPIKSGHPLNLGSANEGSYSVSVSGKSRTELPVYFPHADLGIIYFSGLNAKLMTPELFPNVSCSEFIKILNNRNIPHNLSCIIFKDNSIKLG